MKHMGTRLVPERVEPFVDKTTCDLCGQTIQPRRSGDAHEITVERKEGSSYPEGGSGTAKIVDMCGSCWDTKFEPWLLAMGVTPISREWDW